MKNSASVVIVLFFVAMVGQSGKAQNILNSNHNAFLGAWRLASLEEPGSDGKLHAVDCTGQLVYTPDSHMSVQVMYRAVAPANTAAPVQYAQGGYEASFGTYRINDDHTFTFHVEGALVRTLIGKDLNRSYELSGNRLIVKSANANEQWRVVWERY